MPLENLFSNPFDGCRSLKEAQPSLELLPWGHPPAFGVGDTRVKTGCTPTEHTVWGSGHAFSCDPG